MMVARPAHGEALPGRPAETYDLDYEAFDQRVEGGWRIIASQGKYRQAAQNIEHYLQALPSLPDWQRRNLHFHAGQLYAFAQRNFDALEHLQQALSTTEESDALRAWNAYVAATAAFLQHERGRLLVLRETVARGPKFNGAVANLDVVDRLLACFGRSYAVAYRAEPGQCRRIKATGTLINRRNDNACVFDDQCAAPEELSNRGKR